MIFAWILGCGAPDGLTAVPEGSGVGSVRWVEGGRETTLERFSPPVDLRELERSPDGRWAFARFQADGRLQVSVYDLAQGSRVHTFAPGFAGELDFTRSGEGFVHVWGCGSGCVTLRVLDRDGTVRVEAPGSGVSVAPDGDALLLTPTVLGPDHPIAWVDLDARRLVGRFTPWEGWEQPVGEPIWGDGAQIPVGDGRLAVSARGASWTVRPTEPAAVPASPGSAAAVREVAAAGTRELALDRSVLSAGDDALLIQSVGPGAGRFERVLVEQVRDAGVTLAAPLSADFGPGAQLVRIGRGAHLTVDGTLSVPPWDGQVGGVLALRAGRLTVNGRIDADGAGLRGGRAPGARHAQSCLTSEDPRNAERGEGLDGRQGTGFLAPSTGGGGGGCHNAGGGGGAGAGAGGQGGYSWINEANTRGDVGGRGGQPAPAGLALGGGGGAGQTDRPEAPGGRGGGVIWVEASEIVGGGGLSARGLSGFGPEREGAGGGGGGGTIWLDAAQVEVHADVSGGPGANALEAALGPGGGGGGGRIVGPPGMDAVLTGGPGGLDPRGDPYGATAGQPGVRVPRGQ